MGNTASGKKLKRASGTVSDRILYRRNYSFFADLYIFLSCKMPVLCYIIKDQMKNTKGNHYAQRY